MTPEEASARADEIELDIEAQARPVTELCAEIHELLDIIGTDPVFNATRVRLCQFITDLGCDPHSACGGST